jgi:hypothetical protein
MAQVLGAHAEFPRTIHATRFKTRKEHASTGPLGDAPHWMKDKNQKDSWNTFRVEIPWLQKSHRALVGIACVARGTLMSGGDFNVRMATLLRRCLGSMGATPIDASKITMPDDGATEKDLSEKYFN